MEYSKMDYSKEKLNLLLILYNVDENRRFTIEELAKMINRSLQSMLNEKVFLLNNRILVDDGKEKRNHTVKGYNREYEVQLYSIDKHAIDVLLFKIWDETSFLFDRAHLYLFRALI